MTTSRGDKTWVSDTLSELTLTGTESGVAVGQLAIVSEAAAEGVYECQIVTATTSTWSNFISGSGGGTDPDAIHTNVSGEIATLTLVTPAADDKLVIEQTSTANSKQRVSPSDIASSGPPQAHTIAFHDTTATGTELDTLTDGSNADALHTHAIAALDTTATGANLDTLTNGSNADALHTHAGGGVR